MKSAKFLNLAFKIEKVKTKYKNSALCLSEKLALFTRYVSYTKPLGSIARD
jgi:hypothetical protein